MRPILFLLIFGLAGLGVLLALGTWQLQRLDQKLTIIRAIDARVGGVPVALPANPDPVVDKYLAVSVTGTLLAPEVHVLIPRKQVGAGYRIIALFQTTDGRRIMVDRGVTPASRKDDTRILGDVQISGNLHWPDETDNFTPEPDEEDNIWFARDVDKMARALQAEPVLLVAATRTDPAVTPTPVDSSAVSNDHLKYAITWFSLALVWLAMSGYFLWRTRSRAESDNS